jgi:hypothetical protein
LLTFDAIVGAIAIALGALYISQADSSTNGTPPDTVLTARGAPQKPGNDTESGFTPSTVVVAAVLGAMLVPSSLVSA